MAVIPPFYLDCVVSIGIPHNEQTNWTGTGFIVGRFFEMLEGKKSYKLFLVTNKHVLQDKNDIVIRFSDAEHKKIIDYPITLIREGKRIWHGHPAEEVDVASFFINHEMLQNDSAAFSCFSLDENAVGIDEMKDMGVYEGDAVNVLGFPMGIVSDQAMYVIARYGIISRIRDVLNGQETSFLIDSNIFPGNSGGPVIIRPEISAIQGTKAIDRASLIGIVKSYVPYRDVAVSQQTGTPRIIFEENSGLALVDTVDSIRETVEICYQKMLAESEEATEG
jgi:hypothetical protein